MSKKENLFLLIKSLTKAEKRYFKLFASSTKGDKQKHNNYLLLFEAIDKQESYDEAAIKQRFSKQAFTKQLHVTKNYLSQLILKSLRNFHAKLSKESELRDLLKDIEILFHKELYAQCQDVINKACQVAKEYECLHLLLDVNRWKRRLCLATSVGLNSNNTLNAIHSENTACLTKLNHLHHYWDWTINFFERIDPYKNHPDSLLTNEWFQDASKADTIQAQKLYHHILMAYYVMAKQDYAQAIKVVDDLIEMLEENPKHITEDLGAYLTALNNKVSLLLDMKQYDSIPSLLQKVRAAATKYKVKTVAAANLKVQLHTYNLELELYRDTDAYETGVALIPEIADFLQVQVTLVPDDYLLCFYYQFAYLYFRQKQYTTALQWLNRILATKFDSSRQDLQSFTRFLHLIIHFELGNIIVLKYAVEACRRFLKKEKKVLAAFEKKLLSFFSKICTQPPDKFQHLFGKLQEELFVGSSSKERNQCLDYLNFEQWIAENLQKKSFF
ncbi:hypothetical protein [uncultured Microscilla sp.]|uniref:hypothetical protein n=1 Tax=uncultured Microscilla sp. TaxID=432653 RepID=UPI002609ED40|nr:hypothetical protein [uncultured Microscilla sp.]